MKTYKITHETGTGQNDGGNSGESYFFTLIGSEGQTAAHICPANRTLGQVGSCIVQDRTEIGELKAVRIKSVVKDSWAIVDFEVEIDGLAGIWRYKGKTMLGHEGTVTLNFKYQSTYTFQS